MIESVSFITLNMVLTLVLFLVSVILPFFQILFMDKYFKFQNIPEILLKYALFFNVGCLFIMGAAGQFLYGYEIASWVAWSWSPFQYELAFSEISLGILGLLSPLFSKEFWLATIIGAVIWLIGGSSVHLYSLIVEGNTAITTASFVIMWNLLVSAWLLGCYLAYCQALPRLGKLLSRWKASS